MHLYSAEQPNELDSEQEYLTWAEIYISNAASTTLRKVNKHYWLLAVMDIIFIFTYFSYEIMITFFIINPSRIRIFRFIPIF